MKLPANEIKKIAIFRALQLGDMLCSIPAIRALRHAYPEAEITLIGLPWAKFLVDRFPNYFNKLISFPGYPGFPEQEPDFKAIPSFLEHVQKQQFDVVLQMQGNGTTSNPLVKLFSAKHTAGFYKKGNYCPDPNLFIDYPAHAPEVERHLQLMHHLEVEAKGKELEFPLTKQDEAELETLSLPVKKGKYIIVHPGSRGLERRWAPEYFASVADYCKLKGLEIILTGTKDELPVVESVAGFMKEKAIIAAGKTSLGAVGVLIKNAFALISNCTGVSHMAAALKTRSIVISLDGEPDRWAPFNKELHKTFDWTRSTDFNKVLETANALISNRC